MMTKYLLVARHLLKTFGLLDVILDCLWMTRHLKHEIAFRKNNKKINQNKVSDEITAVILTVGHSKFIEKCIESIEKQTLRPRYIEIIRDIKPFSKASQTGLDSVKTPFYVPVDDDMILHDHCFKRLYHYISTDNNCAETILRLKDPILGRIYGIHMYRVDVVGQIGFHPLYDEKGCERRMIRAIESLGFSSLHIDVVGGQHRPVYTPEDAFRKYKFIGEQAVYYQGDKGAEIMVRSLDRLSEYWLETHASVALYAMAGLLAGLTSDNPSEQLTYDGREEQTMIKKIEERLHSIPFGFDSKRPR